MKKRFSLSLFGPIYTSVIWILVIYLVVEIFSIISDSIGIQNLSPKAVGMTVFLVVFSVLAGFLPTWSLIREIKTTFTFEEIRQPKFLGVTKIRWKDVVEVEDTRFLLIIKSKTERITISLAMYQKPQEIVTFTKEMIKTASK